MIAFPRIAKLNTYIFNETSLKVIISYLKNRTQTTKVGSSFSELLNIIYSILLGSILGPLLFIIYIYIYYIFIYIYNVCDLFIVNKDVKLFSYGEDTISFITGMSFEQIIPELGSILLDMSHGL